MLQLRTRLPARRQGRQPSASPPPKRLQGCTRDQQQCLHEGSTAQRCSRLPNSVLQNVLWDCTDPGMGTAVFLKRTRQTACRTASGRDFAEYSSTSFLKRKVGPLWESYSTLMFWYTAGQKQHWELLIKAGNGQIPRDAECPLRAVGWKRWWGSLQAKAKASRHPIPDPQKNSLIFSN